MRTGATKPEWDTPPHGDFASYVERLTASPPPAKPPKNHSAARAGRAAPAPQSAGSAVAGTTGLPPDLVVALQPIMGALRAARAALLVFTALHAAALFVFGQGSVPGLMVMALLWWGLGRLLQMTPASVSQGASAATGKPGLEPLQERLRQVADQRNTGKKKRP